MKSPDPKTNLPVYVETVTAELAPGAWQPESLQEYLDLQESSILLEAWREQQRDERSLRKMIAVWVFILISAQILAIFALVLWDGGQHKADPALVKILIPSVLAEVLGMGFFVVKYLFRPGDLPLIRRKKK